MNIEKAAQTTTQTPLDQKNYNCGERGHYFNGCPNPHIHLPSTLITNTTPTSSENTIKVCFHCGQSGHFALHCPDRRQRQTPAKRKCYNCEERGHLAITCSNPHSRPPLPPSTKASNHKGVLHQSKQPRHVLIMDMLFILPINASTSVNYRPQPKATRMWHELWPIGSATTVDRRVTLLMFVSIHDTTLM
jgi:hypothetical protein